MLDPMRYSVNSTINLCRIMDFVVCIREYGSTLSLCRDGIGYFVFPIPMYRSENPK